MNVASFWDIVQCSPYMNQRFGRMLDHIQTAQRYNPEGDNFQGSSLFADLIAFPQSEHTELLVEICL
jgi:hypothetical protein